MLIAQLSDPHLRPKGVLYQGVVDSNAQFEAAIGQLNRLSPQPDLVLISGDITEEAAPAEYALARELIAAIRQPLLVIPGNHDEREAFRRSFADLGSIPEPARCISRPANSVRCGSLAWTSQCPVFITAISTTRRRFGWNMQLAAEPDRPTIVMMHQPPFATGISYVDDYWCRNGERLAGLIARFPHVERVACGHVHRFMQVRFGGTLLCTAPSTASAIALRLDADAEPASYLEPPAFLLHHWKEDAGLVTHLVPVGTFPGPFDFA